MSESVSAPNSLWNVGSAPDCDIVVNQPVVSGHHCCLSRQGDEYILEDLGSTNGTFVNGYRLEPRSKVYVSSTDRITLGRDLPLPWPSSNARSAAPERNSRGSSSQVMHIGR